MVTSCRKYECKRALFCASTDKERTRYSKAHTCDGYSEGVKRTRGLGSKNGLVAEHTCRI